MEQDIVRLLSALGIEKVWHIPMTFLSPEALWQHGLSPDAIWPGVKSLFVLGVRDLPVAPLPAAKEAGAFDVCSNLLDTAAYRLARHLNDRGYPSVNLPVDGTGEHIHEFKTVPVYRHKDALDIARCMDAQADGMKLSTVFTRLEGPGAYTELRGYAPGIHPTKQGIEQLSVQAGAERVGFASVDAWGGPVAGIADTLHPRDYLSDARTVIVLAAPLWIPITDMLPSILGRDQLIMADKLLEKAAYRLMLELSAAGSKVVGVPKPPLGESAAPAAYFHDQAGYRAGLGRIGKNGRLLTEAFGPRVALKVLLTDLALPGDTPLSGDECGGCSLCAELCPAGALKATGEGMARDAARCLEQRTRLDKSFCEPCGQCVRVCPAGLDRTLFAGAGADIYRAESMGTQGALPAIPFAGWNHVRSFGSLPVEPPDTRCRRDETAVAAGKGAIVDAR